MITIGLINNITLLVSLSIIHTIILYKWPLRAWKFQIVTGVLFGAVAVTGMLNSLELQPGVFFDGRTIILTIAGAFGGPIAAAIAVVISASYRYAVGGPGVWMGIATILSSALLGLSLHRRIKNSHQKVSPGLFYLLGLGVHVMMLASSLLLPGGLSREFFAQVALPVILIYPLTTLLMAILFQAQEKHVKTVHKLKESEERFRLVFQNSLAVYLLVDPDDASIWDANQAAADFYGWPLQVLRTKKMDEINTLGKEVVAQAVEKAIGGSKQLFTFKHRLANGVIKDVEVLSGPVEIENKILLLSTIIDITEKKKAHEALHRERQLLRTLIDNIPDRVSVKDLEERRILTNLSELLYFGMSHPELSQKKDVEMFEGTLGKQMEADDHQVLKTGHAIINKEEKLPGRYGQPVWMLTSRIPLHDEQDQVAGLVSISRDITQRRQDEEQIRNLSLVAENTSNLVVISDGDDRIIWVNTSFLNRTGYILEEVLEKPVGQILQGPKTDPQHVKMMMEGVTAKKAFRQEILNYTKSGEEIWLEVFVNPVLDARGNIEKIIAISIDITESKQSELRLRQSIKSYSDLFNSLDEAIYIQDKKGNILDLNQGAVNMYGYSREEALGKNPDFLCAPFKNHMPVLYEKIKQAYEGKIQKLEFWAMKKNGEIFPKEIHLYPGEFFSKKVVLAVAQDITERKQSEELKNSLEVAKKTAGLKQQFLANVSHEMRTPMNGVLGMSGILRKTSLDPTQLQYLHIIEDSARSMLEIINDVLQLSKIEAGKQEVHQKKINTNDFIHRVQSLFTPLAQNKGLSFSTQMQDTVPKAFISDENKLLQVLNNLIGNAIKFTSQGGIKLFLEGFISHEQKSMIRVRVEDTGKGISPEFHSRIFDEFAQVDPTPTREAGGTGLGLTITKRMVELLGGTVGLESQPGKGSTFSFTFSFKKVQEPFASEKTAERTENEAPGPLNLSVLLVEDKKVNQMVASLVLKEMGCRVDLADNGLKALEKVKQKQYDAILMDIQMPVMDGVTAVKNLRRMNISLPLIIGLSAEAMEGDAEKYISLGMDDYLTKPLDANLLYHKLSRLIDQALEKE